MMKIMKKKVLNLVIILLAAAGSILLIYPFANFWLSQRGQSYAVRQYDDSIAKMDTRKLKAEWERVAAYNAGLFSSAADPFTASPSRSGEEYLSLLNINEDAIMCHIKIPSINVSLPVYHGTSPEVLLKGVGHLEGSNLPIGGEGNHAIFTGHTGLSTAKLFTDLTEMETGDVFYIVVLDQTLAYEVDQILVVEPDEIEALCTVEGADYVTLVTCTPYGINSHRLLVRGTRVPFTEENEKELVAGAADTINWLMLIIISLLIAIALCTFICISHKNP